MLRPGPGRRSGSPGGRVARWTSRSRRPLRACAARARATDLSESPPARIEVGAAETLRDEDVACVHAIRRAGGQAELRVSPGAFHGFGTFAPRAAISYQPGRPRRPFPPASAHPRAVRCERWTCPLSPLRPRGIDRRHRREVSSPGAGG
ncbi:alpha/beta hydrolase [Streptomyces sp. NPDC015032]|uniref:alpha/beta hydrolase n=1 Tax=Streptomyces sp. NPDC015032 TaxID=3364937 RepID=UPI0036F62E94